MATVIPVDALEYVDRIIAAAITSVSNLSGFGRGTRIPAGKTPARFIRYELVGGQDVHRVGDRAEIRVQVWLDGPDRERNRVAGILLAHLRSKMGRKTSGPVNLPDPADVTKSLTQFTVSVLLIGKQEKP